MNQESRSNHDDQQPPPTIEGPQNGYEDCEKLKLLIRGGKYRLDCGHHVTLNHNLGNNIAIINGKDLQIICTLCLY